MKEILDKVKKLGEKCKPFMDKVLPFIMKNKRYLAAGVLFICFVVVLVFFTGSDFNSERIAKLKLTKREVFLALYNDKGVTPEMIKEGISDKVALIEFEYANEYYRGNPLIDIIGTSLGYSKSDLDYLFNGLIPQKLKKLNLKTVSIYETVFYFISCI